MAALSFGSEPRCYGTPLVLRDIDPLAVEGTSPSAMCKTALHLPPCAQASSGPYADAETW